MPIFENRADGSTEVERRARALPWKVTAGLLALTVLVLVTWAWRAPRQIQTPLTRLEVELQSDGSLGSEVGTDVQIAPDGTRLAFVAMNENAVPHLYTLRLNEQKVTEMDGSEGARGQFFSPDGQWIVFWAHRSIKKVPAAGGPPIHLCDSADLLA